MESLSRCLTASPPFLNQYKTLKSATPKSHLLLSNYITVCSSSLLSSNSPEFRPSTTTETQNPNHLLNNTSRITTQFLLKPHFSLCFLGFTSTSTLSCFASETTAALSTEQVPGKINLESVLVSIDNFFNKYPFFVATVTFIWLVVIPLTEEYLQKYKFISAFNAFKKLKDDPYCQLLDIRDSKSLAYLGTPNLKIFSKSAVQIEFQEGDEDGFVSRVLEIFGDPANTTVCVVDNFDGNSMKVAELLVTNGFKEAYAIRGGIRGKKGWQEIQETLLPPSVHVYAKKMSSMSKQTSTNGGIHQRDVSNYDVHSNAGSGANQSEKKIISEDIASTSPTVESKPGQRPSSPYPNYPGLKPPSSPTPSKPK